MLLGGLLLLALVTGLSLLVRHSFVSLGAIDEQHRLMDQAVARLAAGKASLEREQILVERSLLHLAPPASDGEPAVAQATPAPHENEIVTQARLTQERLDVARDHLYRVSAAPNIDAESAAHRLLLDRLLHSPAEFEARRLTAQRLEAMDESLSQKFMLLDNQHRALAARLMNEQQGLEAHLIGVCGTAILAAVVLIAGMILFTLAPLRTAARAARRIGQGDLQGRIDWQRSDELGTLATEFNRLAIRLRDLRDTETGRREMEYQLSDAVVQSIFEPVIVTDGRGQVLRLNGAARELLGNATDVRTALANAPGGDQVIAAIRSAIAQQRTVGGGEGEAALAPLSVGAGGRNFRLRATPIRDTEGHLLGAVTVLEDVTELQAVDRFKTRFLAIASQKLRDPLEKLRIAIHALSRGYAGELRPLQADVLEGASTEAQRMDDLMADLFAVAQLDSGNRTLKLEAARPLDLLREAQANAHTAAVKHGVTVEIEAAGDLRRVDVDRRAMRSIFENLLSNALRYTTTGGYIRLSATEGKHAVQFSVADTGRGIEPERLSRIFERFNSADGDGTGLGLSLVRRLVEAHGGQVAVDSRLQAGTTFTFTLPATLEQETRHPVEAG